MPINFPLAAAHSRSLESCLARLAAWFGTFITKFIPSAQTDATPPLRSGADRTFWENEMRILKISALLLWPAPPARLALSQPRRAPEGAESAAARSRPNMLPRPPE